MIREMFIGVEGRVLRIPISNYAPEYLQEREKNFNYYKEYLKKENFHISPNSKEEKIYYEANK
jgi:hypothetical protein